MAKGKFNAYVADVMGAIRGMSTFSEYGRLLTLVGTVKYARVWTTNQHELSDLVDGLRKAKLLAMMGEYLRVAILIGSNHEYLVEDIQAIVADSILCTYSDSEDEEITTNDLDRVAGIIEANGWLIIAYLINYAVICDLLRDPD